MEPLTTIWIYEAGLTPNYSVYTVVHDGAVLVERVRDPEPEAARALEALGVTGVMITRDARTDAHRSTATVQRLAKLTTRENRTEGLAMRKWRPPPASFGGGDQGG